MNAIHLVTGAQMAAIDRRAMAAGIPGLDLMEAAGQGVTRVLEDLVGGFTGRRIVVLCGKGNNGGDGFVVARHAAEKGAQVRVFLAASADDIQGDARVNLGRIAHLPVVFAGDLSQVREALTLADGAVDALLGTGIRGGARGRIADLIALLQQAACPIAAIDVPSGLDADTGQTDGVCAVATCTVTFARPRIGQFFYPGRALCGRLHVIDIGIPDDAIEAEGIQTFLMDAARARSFMPRRTPDAHKGDCGRVCIIAGSVGLTGAAALSAGAALRSGAGLVTLGVPESLNDILEVKVTEAMTCPLPEVRKARCLSLRAHGAIARLLERADAAALGPGLGTHRETVEMVRRVVRNLRVPAVIDADALNALSGDLDAIRACKAPLILTPHPGEFCRLTGLDIQTIRRDPIQAVRTFAADTGATVVLKGAPTTIAGDAVFVNPTGNAGMATGGTGDVLTGILAALLGQGVPAFEAACLGVYVHGLAGDLAVEQTGQTGLVAGDLISTLPEAFRRISEGCDAHRYFNNSENGN